VIKVVRCEHCNTNIKFDTELVKLFEFENNVVTGLIICPACKKLVPVSKVDRNKTDEE